MAGVLCSMVGASFVTAVAEVIRRKNGITAVGNAQVDTAQSKFGGASALFDGNNDYLVVSNGGFNWGTGDFTVEAWVRHAAINDQQVYWDFRSGDSDQHIFYIKSNNTLEYYDGAVYTSTTTLAANTWYHLALSRSSGTIKLFINGTQEWSNANTRNHSNTASIHISNSVPALNTNCVNGHMDELRVSNTGRYTANFTPSTTAFVNDANTLLLIHADGTDASTFFEDDNGTGRGAKGVSALGNAQVDTAQSQFGGTSALLDGTGDYLFLSSDPDFAFGTGDFTMEGWIRFVNFSSGPVLFDMRSSGGNEVKPTLYFTTGGVPKYFTNGLDRITGSALSINTWYHIALSRSGTSTKLFVNGTQVGSTYSDSNNYVQSWLAIGIYPVNTSFGAHNGWIDEVRISSSARYTANFTSSTTPFVNDSNTKLLIHMDGTDGSTVFRDDNGVGRSQRGVSALGNAQIDTAQSKFGGSSALFDGSGDYLLVNSHSSFAYGTGDFTIEFWVRPVATANTIILWDQRPFGVQTLQPTIYINNGTIYYYTNSANRITGSALSINTWYHIAVSRSGTSTKLFVNGTQQGSTYTDSNNYISSSSGIWIGGDQAANANWFNGHIDEVRISNSARYTANFTSSTTPFQNDSNTLLLLHMDGTDASTVFVDDNGVSPTHSYT